MKISHRKYPIKIFPPISSHHKYPTQFSHRKFSTKIAPPCWSSSASAPLALNLNSKRQFSQFSPNRISPNFRIILVLMHSFRMVNTKFKVGGVQSELVLNSKCWNRDHMCSLSWHLCPHLTNISFVNITSYISHHLQVVINTAYSWWFEGWVPAS